MSGTTPDQASGREGHVEWRLPSTNQSCKTWYIIHGELLSTTVPLLVLHGGPGMPHEHMLSLLDLHTKHNTTVIFYDQIGCGRSSLFPKEKDNATFWTTDLFIAEIQALIQRLKLNNYDVLGHSWGGMLAAAYAIQQPHGLRRLVLGSAPANMQTWYKVQRELRDKLPADTREVLEMGESKREFDSKAYNAAQDIYYSRHLYRGGTYPKEIMVASKSMMKDPTVMQTLNGPCEFLPLGTLATFNITAEIHKINVPTLLLNGRYDQAQDEVVLPFFQRIRRVKWIQFAESSHLWIWEERERASKVIADFLRSGVSHQ